MEQVIPEWLSQLSPVWFVERGFEAFLILASVGVGAFASIATTAHFEERRILRQKRATADSLALKLQISFNNITVIHKQVMNMINENNSLFSEDDYWKCVQPLRGSKSKDLELSNMEMGFILDGPLKAHYNDIITCINFSSHINALVEIYADNNEKLSSMLIPFSTVSAGRDKIILSSHINSEAEKREYLQMLQTNKLAKSLVEDLNEGMKLVHRAAKAFTSLAPKHFKKGEYSRSLAISYD